MGTATSSLQDQRCTQDDHSRIAVATSQPIQAQHAVLRPSRKHPCSATMRESGKYSFEANYSGKYATRGVQGALIGLRHKRGKAQARSDRAGGEDRQMTHHRQSPGACCNGPVPLMQRRRPEAGSTFSKSRQERTKKRIQYGSLTEIIWRDNVANV